MSIVLGLTKLILFMLAARRVPFGPAHELFRHGNVLIETVETNLLVIFIGTSIGWCSLARLLRLSKKVKAEFVSL